MNQENPAFSRHQLWNGLRRAFSPKEPPPPEVTTENSASESRADPSPEQHGGVTLNRRMFNGTVTSVAMSAATGVDPMKIVTQVGVATVESAVAAGGVPVVGFNVLGKLAATTFLPKELGVGDSDASFVSRDRNFVRFISPDVFSRMDLVRRAFSGEWRQAAVDREIFWSASKPFLDLKCPVPSDSAALLDNEAAFGRFCEAYTETPRVNFVRQMKRSQGARAAVDFFRRFQRGEIELVDDQDPSKQVELGILDALTSTDRGNMPEIVDAFICFLQPVCDSPDKNFLDAYMDVHIDSVLYEEAMKDVSDILQNGTNLDDDVAAIAECFGRVFPEFARFLFRAHPEKLAQFCREYRAAEAQYKSNSEKSDSEKTTEEDRSSLQFPRHLHWGDQKLHPVLRHYYSGLMPQR